MLTVISSKAYERSKQGFYYENFNVDIKRPPTCASKKTLVITMSRVVRNV